MRIYIASSWRNQHAVEMLTDLLRERGHEVVSFVEVAVAEETRAGLDLEEITLGSWIASEDGRRKFLYDTAGATQSDLVIYIAPSGTDAWAEVGAAWGNGVTVLGLWAKGEQAGLMRRMVRTWYADHRMLLEEVDRLSQRMAA